MNTHTHTSLFLFVSVSFSTCTHTNTPSTWGSLWPARAPSLRQCPTYPGVVCVQRSSADLGYFPKRCRCKKEFVRINSRGVRNQPEQWLNEHDGIQTCRWKDGRRRPYSYWENSLSVLPIGQGGSCWGKGALRCRPLECANDGSVLEACVCDRSSHSVTKLKNDYSVW